MPMKTEDDEKLFEEFPSATPAEWRKAAEEALAGASFEKKLVTKTPEGIDLRPIYTAEDLANDPLQATWPGLPPYLRGSTALGSRSDGWKIAQELPYGKPQEFNQALLQDLNRGQNCVNLLFDIATRLGLDPDSAKPGEVGGCGLSLATVDDVDRALRGVDLGAVPIHAPSGISALSITALLAAWLAEQGKKPSALHGAVLADPITEWVGAGSLPGGLTAAYDEMAALTDWVGKNRVRLRTVGVHANLWADAGGSAVHELAFGLATGVEYLRELGRRKLTVNRAAPRFLFTLSLGSQFFTEIAKIRAARLLWARVTGAAGGNAEAGRLEIHGRTSLWNKTVLDPQVNLLRTTSEAFSGIVAGCTSIHVAPFDECFRVPDDFSRRLARNIQIILAEECQLNRVVDPAGGSWYVETLTLQLAERAWSLFQEVERKGGMVAALRAGFPQEAVAKCAGERIAGAETRRDGIIGTNLHPNLKEKLVSVQGPDYADLASKRAAQIANYRTSPEAERGAEVLAGLATLLDAPASTKMATLIDAFLHGATLGEVTRVLRSGREPEAAVARVRLRRRSEAFEAIRRRSEAFKERTGARPKVFLANLGPRKQHGARADFSAGFFAAGGFETIPNKGFGTPEEAAKAALESGAPVVVICSTDETYPLLVPPIAAALKAAPGKPQVILAGLPAGQTDALRAAGVDDFIHVRANCAQMLAALQDKLGL
jgi:methylmalonyl-CoA mutase